ncbi:hypothetical protein AB0L10_13765 [Streptomyces flaveolus]|uniref:hypothetical protein n=1 Tax=Streptomyces flaveolus TaxID=67297 RepID=UPI003422DDA8
MTMRHTAAWVAFTTAALVAASGCGTEGAKTAVKAVDKADKAMAALARATDRTEGLGSAEVRMSTDLGNGDGPVTMEGTFSWGKGYAYDVQMDTKAAGMQTLQDAPEIHCLFVDGAYYYDVDPQPSGPLRGKEWMKVDASAVLGEKGARSISGSAGSPTASMKGLKYANDVEDLGAQTVNGHRATHYRAVVDQAHLGKFRSVYSDKDSLMGSMTGGASSLTMDIWVDDKDLPVRMKQKVGALTVTMDFERFGRTATVKAPPAGRVADLTDVIKKQQSRQG